MSQAQPYKFDKRGKVKHYNLVRLPLLLEKLCKFSNRRGITLTKTLARSIGFQV